MFNDLNVQRLQEQHGSLLQYRYKSIPAPVPVSEETYTKSKGTYMQDSTYLSQLAELAQGTTA